jgi:transposase
VAPVEVGRPLTDVEWHRIFSLLPPQRPPVGRPRHDHRTVLNGILAVLCSGTSWREMPQEYGKWETAYRRYRLWQDEGRLQRILEALDRPTPYPPP